MNMPNLTVTRSARRLDDDELSGIAGGKVLAIDSTYSAEESIPWTKLNPSLDQDRVPMEALTRPRNDASDIWSRQHSGLEYGLHWSVS